ncbi:coiled-coil domain-containing protein 39-like [Centruroides vittatus]|uniref:coiled-coil domain-containing protein 39-like n=1 Tax=Centruroides vittatus TaxID=120091 RepID=UPI00350EEF42
MDIEYNFITPKELENVMSKGTPIFPIVNDENRLLAEELAKVRKEICVINTKIDDKEKLNSLLEDHHTNVIKEINSLNQMLQSRKQEIETGESVDKLLLREKSWLDKQMKISNKERTSNEGRQEQCRIFIDALIKKKEKIQNDLRIDKETMEKWIRNSENTEEDIKILEKYKFMNNNRIRDMEIKLENASNDSKNWRTLANEINLEISSLQAELYRLAEDFKQAHRQRCNVINQIDKGMEKIERKDEETNELLLQLNVAKEEAFRVEEDITDRKNFLDKCTLDNKELEKLLKHLEQELESISYELVCIQKKVDDSKSELEAQRLLSSNMTSKLSQLYNEKKEKEKQINEKQTHLDHLRKEKKELEKDFLQIKMKEADEEQCLQHLEEDIQNAEINFKKEQSNLGILLSIKLKTMKELEESKLKEKVLINNLKTAKFDIKNLQKKKSQDELKLFQFQEELHKLDYQILKLEQRIKRLRGDSSKQDELTVLKSKVQALKKIHDEKEKNLKFLNTHVNNNREEIFRLNKKLQQTKSEQQNILSKRQEINLCLSSTETALKQSITVNEELVIEECILKLKLKQLLQLLNQKSEDVISIQKEKIEFEANVKHQLDELNNRKNILKTEIRHSDQQRQTLANQLNKFLTKLETLQTRYKCVLAALGLKNDEEGKEVDLLIQTEHKKAEIRNLIYRKTEAVRNMSEEMRNLKNCLILIKATNIIYRQYLRPAEDENTRYIREMETKKNQFETYLNQKKEELNIIQKEIVSMRLKIKELSTSYEVLQNILAEKSHILQKAKQILFERKEKLKRSDKINNNLCQNAKYVHSKAAKQINDIKIRLMKEVNKRVFNFLTEICEKHPEICEKIEKMFSEASLELQIKSLGKPLTKFNYLSITTRLNTPTSRCQSKLSSKSSSSVRSAISTNVINLDYELN